MRKIFILALALTAAGLPSCHCPVVEDDEVRSGTFAPTPELGNLLGVAQYQMMLSKKAGARVELIANDGTSRGHVDLAASTERDVSWTYTAPEGQKAVLRILRIKDFEGGSWNRLRFEAEGKALELELVADAESKPLRMVLATQGDQPGLDGTLMRRADGFNQVLQLPLDGSVGEAEILTWLEGAGIQPLLESRAAFILATLSLDPELIRGLARLVEDLNMQGTGSPLVQAIHKSALCEGGTAATSAFLATTLPVCITCAVKLVQGSGIPGLGTLLAIISCRNCVIALGTWAIDVFICSIASEILAESDATCQAKSPCDRGYDSKANPTEHSCLCVCNEQFCDEKYKESLRAGETLCASGCGALGGSTNVCEGSVSVCGDGVVQDRGNCKEQCDFRAMPTRCANGQWCNEKCECVDEKPDAGGPPDAGEPPDAGVPDAGSSDGGSSDAGMCDNTLCGMSTGGSTCMMCGTSPVCAPPDSICCTCECGNPMGGGVYTCPAGSTCGGNACWVGGTRVALGACPGCDY